MTPAKVRILVTVFAYSGNGGIPSTAVPILKWLSKLTLELEKDERVGGWFLQELCDTPITMTRNRAVKTAQDGKFDFLLMIDSDMHPDLYPDQPGFFKTAFDFAYQRKMLGQPTIIGAPYTGPPVSPLHSGESNTYVFRWYQTEEQAEGRMDLRFLSRSEAASLRGIQPMAALPTGLILYDIAAFDLIKQPYFIYEYRDSSESEKVTTEDVYNTREISLAAAAKGLGEVCYATMDSWAGHMKVKTMGKPWVLTGNMISQNLRDAWIEKEEIERTQEFNPPANPKEPSRSVQNVIVKPRTIFGKKVWSVVHVTPMSHLNALQEIVEAHAHEHPDRKLRVVEVGSWVGESAIALAEGMIHGGHVYCVDSFGGNQGDYLGSVAGQLGPEQVKEYFDKNTAQLGDTIRLLEGDSAEVAKSFPKQEIDVLFLDSGHTYEEVERDLRAWSRHVAPDGLILVHDMCQEFPDVQKCLHDMFTPDLVYRYYDTSIGMVRMSDVGELAGSIADAT